MTLIKSISGIRGTIGGTANDNLTPVDIVEMTASYGEILKQSSQNKLVVVGRDARISGLMVKNLVIATLTSQGFDVIDGDLSTTPSIEMAVKNYKAVGGIIITASHNPVQWNALKFLNQDGEFISESQGSQIIEIAQSKTFSFNDVFHLGNVIQVDDLIQQHIDAIFSLPLVDKDLVASRKFVIVLDSINSTGTISVEPLLSQMGCEVIMINAEMHGNFAHDPEPLAANLTDLCKAVTDIKADMGISVDPDVDRLSFICSNGSLLGEENTLVTIAEYILQNVSGPTVSNLSSTRGLRDISQKYEQHYFASKVGEVNVVKKMKEVGAVIGGEGNGGVIYPDLHYGRDALVGIALFLTYLAKSYQTIDDIARSLPEYYMSKNKIELTQNVNIDSAISNLIDEYKHESINTEDGLKIDFEEGWVQLRKSNTEPIIRVYSEASTMDKAQSLANDVIINFKKLLS